ncbi:MAG: ribosomal protein S18-alanine N-acetyltransferase [Clostridiales bacterium]|nr:ribosomal protein S18-alanine N-acetyltransferase [Clostridiales bacterium]
MIKYRRMTLADAPAAAALEAANFPMPWPLSAFEFEMLENLVARYMVAEQNGRMIGFAGAHMIFEEGHITNVVVAEGSRGKGIGRALMEALLQYAANLGVVYMTLEVRPSNKTAIALYESLGFIKVAVRAKYYEDNKEDAFIMVCDNLPAMQDDFVEEETIIE